MARFSASNGQVVSGGNHADIFFLSGNSGTAFGGGGDTFTVLGRYNKASGGVGADSFTVSGSFNTLDGQEDGDNFTISGNSNTVYGGAGDDVITLQTGAHLNTIYTDFSRSGMAGGNDLVHGSDTTNTNVVIKGITYHITDGQDKIYSTGGNDTLFGGTEADSIVCSGSAGVLIYGDNALESTLDGGDYLVGGTGADSIYGGGGNDTIYGEITGTGADLVYGGSGRDLILTGAGADTLSGGLGVDTLVGGLGADRSVFSSVTDSGLRGMNRDIINDFSHTQRDVIDISGLTGTGSYLGSAAFSGTALTTAATPEVRSFYEGQNTVVQVDANHDGTADFEIQLVGRINLVTGDFVL